MKKIRIAILGTSHVHLRDHLAVIAQDPEAELVAFHAGAPVSGAIPAAARPSPSAGRALDHADAAVIASTTAEHQRLLELTASAGVPTLVEKPLGTTACATGRLTPLLTTTPVPSTTAMFLRCAPALRRVRTLLAQDALGPIAHVHARFTHPGFLDGIFDGTAAWMLSAEHGGTGGFADLGIHLIDLLGWLAPGRELRVRGAELTRRDCCAFDVGGLALLTWGASPVSLHAGWTSRPGGFLLRIECEQATVEVGTHGTELSVARDRAAHHHERHPPIRAGAALEAFLAGLRGRNRWEAPTPADIERTARLLDAVETAAGASVATGTSARCRR
ncbi:Gfo/Idh/MocA family oxidoreductase [Streptomyces sp. NPDC096191]|uniref:Gfo/Idh/MocA family protein n=1 Tax=Streptomyces sp. NPDC096191 TaxID=3155426 RepID=UPI003333BD40